MDKRTKILLIVLVSLLVIAGGFYAYMFMTAEETVTAVAPPPVPAAKAPQKMAEDTAKEASPTGEEPAEGMEPGMAQRAEGEPSVKPEAEAMAEKPLPGEAQKMEAGMKAEGEPAAKPEAEAKSEKAKPGEEQKMEAGMKAEGKPAAKPEAEAKSEKAKPGEEQKKDAGKKAEGKPAVKPEAKARAEKAKPGAEQKKEAGKKAEGEPAVEPEAKAKEAAKPAPCVPVIVADIKGKKVEFKTPAELVEKSGLDAKALRDLSEKNLDAAKKKVEGIEKAKKPAAELDCAKKGLELADRLAKLIEEKFPVKAEKVVYTYSSLDKRDPFMSPMEIPRVYPPVPKNAPPLERVPSEQLKVQGVMWNERGFRALVTTPDDRGYTVKVGDAIGNKGGKVIRISEKRVYIEERIPDIFGDIEVRNIVLKLHKEAE